MIFSHCTKIFPDSSSVKLIGLHTLPSNGDPYRGAGRKRLTESNPNFRLVRLKGNTASRHQQCRDIFQKKSLEGAHVRLGVVGSVKCYSSRRPAGLLADSGRRQHPTHGSKDTRNLTLTGDRHRIRCVKVIPTARTRCTI